ncbi:MAG: helix-turn-helix domain-containing protein [Christensenellales bacterium]
MVTKKVAMKPERQTVSIKYFKTIEEMSLVSGIGEKTLRVLVENGEIDYISVGNRRLITDSAIWDWYERNKVAAILAESEDELCQSIAVR